MRLRLALLLLCLGGTVSAATLHPTLTRATASDVAREPLSAVAKRLSLEKWSAAILTDAIVPFLSTDVETRPEREQGEPPPGFSNDFDGAVQPFVGVPFAIGNIDSFEGLGEGFRLSNANVFQADASAPDTTGAPGIDQYVQIVNQSLEVFKKDDGTPLLGPIDTREIWHDFDGECGKIPGVDAVVLFDHLANRWLVTMLIVNANNDAFQCVAVSQTSDAGGIYARYEFLFGRLTNDYGKFAVWPDSYYATYDLFDSCTTPKIFKNTRVCAYDRSAMLAGLKDAAQQCVDLPSNYFHLLPSHMDGSPPPAPTPPNFLVAVGLTPKTVNLWRYTINWANPSASVLSGPIDIKVSPYQLGCDCIFQKGTTPSYRLKPMGDRPMFRNTYRAHSGVESLLVTHTVRVVKNMQPLNGIRWYEFNNPRTTPVVAQQSTYSPDTQSRWLPSMAMDKIGNIAIGYTVSSAMSFPSIFVAGWSTSQTTSTLSTEKPIPPASTDFKPNSAWGDYSHMSIDPTDNCTFWYTSEYLGHPENKWHTRIAHFKFIGCQ
jgi:hypothetical protein